MVNFSLEYPDLEEILPLLMVSEKDRYVGDPDLLEEPNEAELRVKYKRWFTRREAIGLKTTLMRKNGKLIGYGMSTRCLAHRAYLSKLPKDNHYWKIGLLFVLPDYRGQGIAKKACEWFLSQKKKMVYFVDSENTISKKIPVAIGLKFSHVFWEEIHKEGSWLPADFPKHLTRGVTFEVYMN